MPRYRVKPGYRHGRRKQYGPGDIVELSEGEAAGFLDKLERIGEEQPYAMSGSPSAGMTLSQPEPDTDPEAVGPQPVDIASLTVDEALAAVDRGDISAADALEAERAGKSRITLIDELQERTQGAA